MLTSSCINLETFERVSGFLLILTPKLFSVFTARPTKHCRTCRILSSPDSILPASVSLHMRIWNGFIPSLVSALRSESVDIFGWSRIEERTSGWALNEATWMGDRPVPRLNSLGLAPA